MEHKEESLLAVCPECMGHGRTFYRGETCTLCNGSGRITGKMMKALEEASRPQDWRLTEAVLAIKIDELSPMDAMTKLYELRRLATEIRGAQ